MRLYVIGPVTGRENLNRKAFDDAKEKLWDAGYDVVIPHDVIPPDAYYGDAMRISIKTMLDCDGVATLPDWDESRGAKLEINVAITCGMQIHTCLAWLSEADSLVCRSSDFPDDDNSPEETQNPPSDGAPAPSDEALGALTRRMDETNELLRAVYYQIAMLITFETCQLTNSANSSVVESVEDTLMTALDYSKAAQAHYDSAGKESQDGEA